MTRRAPIDVGSTWPTKMGEVEVISYRNAHAIDVIFADTRHHTTTSKFNLMRGCVRDPLFKSVYGVGFMGVGDYNSSHPAKRRWMDMMTRCYSTKGRHPSYDGCIVCDDWLNFQTFAKWCEETYPKDGIRYQLDKDIAVCGNKVYSPEACSWVTHEQNVQASTGTLNVGWVFSDGSSERTITNQSQFARELSVPPQYIHKAIVNPEYSICGYSFVRKIKLEK